MIDIKLVRDHPEVVKAACQHKNADVSTQDIDKLAKLDVERREYLEQLDELRRQRNAVATATKAGKPSPDQVAHGKKLKQEITAAEASFNKLDADYLDILKKIPNIPASDVPIGESEADNQVAKTVGKPPKFDFTPKNHWQLAEAAGFIDKERAAKVAGARFAYLKGNLVRLQFAVINLVLDIVTDEAVVKKIAADAGLKVSTKPFEPVLPPLMIRTEVFEAMDRLEPRDDRYKIEGEDLWLQGSAEHVLGSMHMNEIIPEADLPLRYIGFATSFRKEAGSYGKDMEGIFRLHQFDKLEMESLALPEQGRSEHLLMVAIQEYITHTLGLPYQVILKCTADIGKPNARGIDIDTWLPGQGKYRETHTADYMTDYQARRLATRVKRQDGQVELVHTNDATAFAQRTLIAILENNQLADGSIAIPKALQTYYGAETL